MACIRMPTQGKGVDNFSAEGIATTIDLQTGLLGTAVAKDPTRGVFDRHPDSDAPISGFRLPFTSEACELTLKAHACFPWVPFVGWDVVITEEGPVLLEANPEWGCDVVQITMDKPLGETIYPELYLEHLAAQDAGRVNQPSGNARPEEQHVVLAAGT
jgi:hypothetical protein